jgi:exodeoxyribonuclease-3
VPIRFVSWNVNGVRSCAGKGLLDWLASARADVVGLQEVRAEIDEIPEALRRHRRFRSMALSAATSKRGYSGVALLSRVAPAEISTTLGREEFDREGRFLLARFDGLLVANVYFPKGSGTLRDNSRVPYKLAFTRRVFDVVGRARRRTGLPAILLGDFNIAPQPIDLARPRGNETTSGFLPEERALFARCLARGYLDSFRALHPEAVRYSWWSNRIGVRDRNIGWRIDHVVVSCDLLPRVRAAFVWDQVKGSDHCPVGIDLDASWAMEKEASPPRAVRGTDHGGRHGAA